MEEVMNTEVFYTKDNTKNEMLVNVLWTCMIDDVCVVEHEGEEYTLQWNSFRSYYEGRVNGLDGYMV
jgi:hypothetical protein